MVSECRRCVAVRGCDSYLLKTSAAFDPPNPRFTVNVAGMSVRRSPTATRFAATVGSGCWTFKFGGSWPDRKAAMANRASTLPAAPSVWPMAAFRRTDSQA